MEVVAISVLRTCILTIIYGGQYDTIFRTAAYPNWELDRYRYHANGRLSRQSQHRNESTHITNPTGAVSTHNGSTMSSQRTSQGPAINGKYVSSPTPRTLSHTLLHSALFTLIAAGRHFLGIMLSTGSWFVFLVYAYIFVFASRISLVLSTELSAG
jgi:hypothetical protein